MALSLDQIRARIKEKEAKAGNGGGGGGRDNAIYPYWDLPIEKQAVVRFLPNGDESADYCYEERQVVNLEFPYAIGAPDAKKVKVTVPCLNMWADLKGQDPILQEIKPWWDDEELKPLAKKFYRKISYVIQGFVVDDPLDSEKYPRPENPIRRFVLNPQIFKPFETVFKDTDVEYLPTDYDHGLEFRIIRTKQGEHSNYTTSHWGKKEKALTDAQREAIEKFKLFNLKEFLPQKPTEAHINAIREMFHASVNEEPYDVSRWGQFYKPYGLNVESVNVSEPRTSVQVKKPAVTTAAPAPEADDEEAPWQNKTETSVAETTSAADAALAKVRKATAAPAAESTGDAGGKSDAKAILDIIRKRNAG